jgi:hypothetical protein
MIKPQGLMALVQFRDQVEEEFDVCNLKKSCVQNMYQLLLLWKPCRGREDGGRQSTDHAMAGISEEKTPA